MGGGLVVGEGAGGRDEANKADFGLLFGGTGEGDCLMNGLLRTVPIIERVDGDAAIRSWIVAVAKEYSWRACRRQGSMAADARNLDAVA